MSSATVFYALGDMCQTMFLFYDNVGNILNDAFLYLGFIGFFIWMNYQRKFNKQAAENPNQLK